MKASDCTDARSFILREARLDTLHPERSEFSRSIHAAIDRSMPALREILARKDGLTARSRDGGKDPGRPDAFPGPDVSGDRHS